MNWNDIRFFLAVAKTKSLSEAGRSLNVSTSTVARRIEVLEEVLDLKLFRHHHDGYELTPEGLDLLEPAGSAAAQIRLVERTARRCGEEMAGLVRIDVPELIGQKILLPELKGLTTAYPNLRLDFRSSVLPTRLRAQESDILCGSCDQNAGITKSGLSARWVSALGFGSALNDRLHDLRC